MPSFTNAELRNSFSLSIDGTQDVGDQNTRGSRQETSSLVDGDWELSEALGISFNDAEVSKVQSAEQEQNHWSHVTDSSTTPQPRELSPRTSAMPTKSNEHSKRYSELSTLEHLNDGGNFKSACPVDSAENEPDLLQRLNSEIGIDSIIATETTTYKSLKDELLSDSYLHMNTGIDCEDETPTYSLSNCQEILESELDDTHSIISLRSSHEKSFANPTGMADLSNISVSVTNLKLSNSRTLDVSCNSLTTLSPLINLLRLKEVDASGNRISELRLDVPESFLGLNRLNLQGNVLRSISFPTDNGLQLEVLNLSDNQLKSVHGVENLSLLRELYLDDNRFASFKLRNDTTSIETLSLNGNKLSTFNLTHFPNLEIFRLDRNQLECLEITQVMMHLKFLSIASQKSEILPSDFSKLLGLATLILSDNKQIRDLSLLSLPNQLETLQIDRCDLSEISRNMASRHFRHLKHLDVSWNRIENPSVIRYSKNIRILNISGNSIQDLSCLTKLVKHLSSLEVLDTRYNPLSEPFYSDQHHNDFSQDDVYYAKCLSDSDYVKRLCYRSLLVHLSATSIRKLDGLDVDQRNKKMAERHIAKFKKAMAVGNEEVESGSDGYEQESVPGIFQDWLPVCRPLPQSLMAHEEELFFVVP